MFELSDPARITAGFVLLAAITVTTGGYDNPDLVGKMEATDFQKSFYRADMPMRVCSLFLTGVSHIDGSFVGPVAGSG